MPRIDFYRSLFFLTGMYSNLSDPFNKMEKVFLFFLIRFYILFCENTESNTKKCKRCPALC
jgi:hypothetical protein